MGNKGIIIGFIGQELNDKQKRKIEIAVKTAIEDYDVSDFYFKNEEDMDDIDIEDNETLKTLVQNYAKVNGFIIEKIREYKESHKEKNINTAILIARMADENYKKELYDEVIQGYFIYYSQLESEISYDAYSFKDEYLGNNIDFVFWVSNKILLDKSPICLAAKYRDKNIVIIE